MFASLRRPRKNADTGMTRTKAAYSSITFFIDSTVGAGASSICTQPRIE